MMIRRLLLALVLLSPRLAWASTCSCPSPPADAYGAAVCALHPCTYYRMDDTSGTAAVDTSQSGNGTYVGGFTLNQAGPITTRVGSLGVALNGSTGYVNYLDTGNDNGEHGPSKTNGQAFITVMWVKPSTFGFASLVTQEDPGNTTDNGWAVYTCTTGACGGSDGYAFWMYKIDDTSCGHTANIGGNGTGSWHMITVRTEGNGTELGSAKIFIDRGATNDTQSTFSGCHYGSTLQRRIGANSATGGGYFFDGSIAEFATFGAHFDAAGTEVAQLYDAATIAAGLPTLGRRLFQSARTRINPKWSPVTFGPRAPEAWRIADPVFIVDRLNRKANLIPSTYAGH